MCSLQFLQHTRRLSSPALKELGTGMGTRLQPALSTTCVHCDGSTVPEEPKDPKGTLCSLLCHLCPNCSNP